MSDPALGHGDGDDEGGLPTPKGRPGEDLSSQKTKENKSFLELVYMKDGSEEPVVVTVKASSGETYFGTREGSLKASVENSNSPATYTIIEDDGSAGMSGVHFKIWFDRRLSKFWVKDCRSLNGTQFAEPARHEFQRFWEGVGDRENEGRERGLKPLSAIRASRKLIVVRRVFIDNSRVGADPLDSCGTKLVVLNKEDMALQFIRVPRDAVCPHHVIKHPFSYVVGRKPGEVDVANKDERRVLIEDPDRHMSKAHVRIRYLTQRESTDSKVMFMVQALREAYYIKGTELPEKFAGDFGTLPWHKIAQGESKALAFNDLIMCGYAIFMVTPHASLPFRMKPPQLLAAATDMLSLHWAPPQSATCIKGYTLQVAPRQEDSEAKLEWEAVFGGMKVEYNMETFAGRPLQPNTYYWVRVQARNSGGNGDWSEPVLYHTAKNNLHLLSEEALPVDEDRPVEREGGAPDAFNPAVGLKPIDQSKLKESVVGEGKGANKLAQKSGASIRWKQGRLIAEGAEGRVYFGQDQDSLAMMAVKEVTYDRRDESKQSLIALQEKAIDMLGKLDHQNIVKYIGAYKEDGPEKQVFRIFMEYVPGVSLAKVVQNFGTLSESVASLYIGQILQGLSYLHREGIVHLDMKCDNVLLAIYEALQVCKITDFGIAIDMKQPVVRDADGLVPLKGTIYFMAPEAARQERHDTKCDIWAVGCMVIEMLTGQMPWGHLTQTAAYFAICNTKTGPELPQEITPQCRDFLEQCFRYDSTTRPTAEELIKHPWFSTFSVVVEKLNASTAGGDH